jgi:vacuolar-type H+-ATPase subunit E/Vma4
MEILRTSDAMESQVLEDARNKARRLLEAADKECSAVRVEWQRTLQQETQRLEAVRDVRLGALRQELASSLPLEYLRARLVFIQEAVTGALRGLFEGLSSLELNRIVGGMLTRAADSFKGARIAVSFAGMSADAARRIVQESIPGVIVDEVKLLPEEAAALAGKGVILETVDGRTRYRGTLNELTGLLLEEHREELMTALFGKEMREVPRRDVQR